MTEYSLEGLMLKLKLQYFGYLMRSVDSLEKTLMARGIGGTLGVQWLRLHVPIAGGPPEPWSGS